MVFVFSVMAAILSVVAFYADQNRQRAEQREAEVLAAEGLAEAKSVLSPYCAQSGLVSIILCDEIRDPVKNIQEVMAVLKAEDAYRPELELALALEANNSLQRAALPLPYKTGFEPVVAARNGLVVIGSRAGLDMFSYEDAVVMHNTRDSYLNVGDLKEIDDAPVKNVAWLDNERFLTWEQDTNTGAEAIKIWDATNVARPLPLPHYETAITCAQPQPDKNNLLVICNERSLHLYSLNDPASGSIGALHDPDGDSTFDSEFDSDRVHWSPDGQWLAAFYFDDDTLYVWNMSDLDEQVNRARLAQWPDGDHGTIKGVQITGANQLIAWTDQQVFMTTLDEESKTFDLTAIDLRIEGSITTAAARGKYLAVGIDNEGMREVHIWNMGDDWNTGTNRLLTTLRGHPNEVESIVWTDDGYLLTITIEWALRIWHIEKNGIVQNQGLLANIAAPNDFEYVPKSINAPGNHILLTIPSPKNEGLKGF